MTRSSSIHKYTMQEPDVQCGGATRLEDLVPDADRCEAIQADFWGLADHSGGPDACWPWGGAIFRHTGYGRFQAAGLDTTASRWAYLLTHGAVPAGWFVCHSCDTPLCVNPAHLFAATNRDNQLDSARKGRKRGRVLDENTVERIRRRCEAGEDRLELAAEYGVDPSRLRQIVKRRAWREVA